MKIPLSIQTQLRGHTPHERYTHLPLRNNGMFLHALSPTEQKEVPTST
nr:hypothetical protein Q903MT_gene1609 [Picea sitchensis]